MNLQKLFILIPIKKTTKPSSFLAETLSFIIFIRPVTSTQLSGQIVCHWYSGLITGHDEVLH